MDVTIREATTGDVPTLGVVRSQAIEAACSDVYARPQFADLVAEPRTELAEWVEDDGTSVLVAETAITPVGYVAFGTDGTIHSICTSPEYQRDGVASRLLERVEHRVHQTGGTTLEATVPRVAQGFFDASGFTTAETGEWHGIEATVVRKTLRR